MHKVYWNIRLCTTLHNFALLCVFITWLCTPLFFYTLCFLTEKCLLRRFLGIHLKRQRAGQLKKEPRKRGKNISKCWSGMIKRTHGPDWSGMGKNWWFTIHSSTSSSSATSNTVCPGLLMMPFFCSVARLLPCLEDTGHYWFVKDQSSYLVYLNKCIK